MVITLVLSRPCHDVSSGPTAEYEVGHQVLDSFDHVRPIGRRAASGLCRVKERGHAVPEPQNPGSPDYGVTPKPGKPERMITIDYAVHRGHAPRDTLRMTICRSIRRVLS